MKYRIKISKAIAIILLILARPGSRILFAIGIAIALLGECIRIWSAGNLKKDKTLATGGPYRMARNPLYIGSAFMAVGFVITCVNLHYPFRTLAIAAAVPLFKLIYRMQIEAEEKHLSNLFGAEYENYKSQTPSMTFNLFKWKEAVLTSSFSWAQAVKNGELLTVLGFVGAAVFISLKLAYNL